MRCRSYLSSGDVGGRGRKIRSGEGLAPRRLVREDLVRLLELEEDLARLLLLVLAVAGAARDAGQLEREAALAELVRVVLEEHALVRLPDLPGGRALVEAEVAVVIFLRVEPTCAVLPLPLSLSSRRREAPARARARAARQSRRRAG